MNLLLILCAILTIDLSSLSSSEFNNLTIGESSSTINGLLKSECTDALTIERVIFKQRVIEEIKVSLVRPGSAFCQLRFKR